MTWRTGTKNPHTLYEGERPVGCVFDPADGPRVVELLNAAPVAEQPDMVRMQLGHGTIIDVTRDHFEIMQRARASSGMPALVPMKPPLGLYPRALWEEANPHATHVGLRRRIEAIEAAIHRYRGASIEPPPAWLDELSELGRRCSVAGRG